MHILGVSCFYHDSAAALIEDGMLVAAAEEERFSRIKHDYDFPAEAIDFCLQRAGIVAEDLDYVVFYEKPLLKFERILMTTLGTFPRSWKVFGEAMIAWFNEKLWIKSLLQERLGVPPERILFVEHHLSHAASTFLCSPFEEAAILTVDGVGEWATTTMGRGRARWDGQGENSIHLFREQRFPHSLGLLYSAFTAYLGFKVNNGEFKVMGMAPYGTPQYMDEVHKLIEIEQGGGFRLNMRYFSYHHSSKRTFNDRFVELFGPPRVPEAPFFTEDTDPDLKGREAERRENHRYADVAASIQCLTEEMLLDMAHQLHRETGLKRLCMAGGVALNSVANGRILRETPFEELYIQPAAGDSGAALGAALYVHHILFQNPRRFVLEHSYWGQEYTEEEIAESLETCGMPFERIEDDEALLDRVVDDLTGGKVVGWFQGRFEWGPRALGNRSILADPRRQEMKEIVNRKIKFREPFRPFAPVVLEDQAEAFFDGFSEPSKQYAARFMLFVWPLTDARRDSMQAVDHMGTGRLQTIRREWNPRYHRVVEKFGEATGVPVLMNTSFNLRGEAIVNTPENALDTFRRSGIDTLVMEHFLIRKR